MSADRRTPAELAAWRRLDVEYDALPGYPFFKVGAPLPPARPGHMYVHVGDGNMELRPYTLVMGARFEDRMRPELRDGETLQRVLGSTVPRIFGRAR